MGVRNCSVHGEKGSDEEDVTVSRPLSLRSQTGE